MGVAKTKNQMAAELGISLRTLQRWIKKHNLDIPRGLISPNKQKEILIAFGYQNEISLNTSKTKRPEKA